MFNETTPNPCMDPGDPTGLSWPLRQATALIPFRVVAGRPVRPGRDRPVRVGRGEMWRWGESATVDALITVTYQGHRRVLLVERDDGYGWAIPGGHVDPGETPGEARDRELAEETGLALPREVWTRTEPRVVQDDPRTTDEAWITTVLFRADLGPVDALPRVRAGDDAADADWLPADTLDGLTAALTERHGRVFAAHTQMLTDALGDHF